MSESSFSIESFQQQLTGVVNSLGAGFNEAITNAEPREKFELPVGDYVVDQIDALSADPSQHLRIEEQKAKDGTKFSIIRWPLRVREAKPVDGSPSDLIGVEGVKEFVLYPVKDKNTGKIVCYEAARLKEAVKCQFGEYPQDAQVVQAFAVGCRGKSWNLNVSAKKDDPNTLYWNFRSAAKAAG